MPNRILKETICTSGTIEKLTSEQENFFYRLIVNCDDFGRTDGRPRIILTKCYPLKEKMATKDILKLVDSLIDAGLAKSYVSDGQPFLYLVTWEKHQQVRAKRSKFPEPTAEEYNGYHMISDDSTCYRNPIQSLRLRHCSVIHLKDFGASTPGVKLRWMRKRNGMHL